MSLIQYTHPLARYRGIVVILLLTIFSAASCGGHPQAFASPKKRLDFPENRVSCWLHGGRWEPGLLKDYCNLPTDDSGRICSGAADCDGSCLANISFDAVSKMDDAERSRPVAGHCSSWYSNRGCIVLVEAGQLKAICLD